MDFTTKSYGIGSYTVSWNYGDWGIYGANNNNKQWGYARFGGGNNEQSGTATITSPNISDAVDVIEINHNGKSADAYSISTIVLETSENSDFTSLSSTTTVENPNIDKGKSQTLLINIGKQIAANSYYRIKINWSVSKSSNSGLDVYSVVLKKKSSTVPSINIVNEVTFNAEDEEGEIAYSIDNSVDDKSLSASIVDADNVDWLIVGDVTSDKLMLLMGQNIDSKPRTAQIKLEYEGAETKYVTVTQLAPVVKYIVSIEETTNGTLTVTYGEGIFVDDIDELPDGTELTITATPNSGYKLVKWEAIDNDNVVLYTSTEESGTYTVNSDVTFTAEFTEIPSYEVTIEAPENGTLTVMNGETEVKSGDMVLQGTELTIEVEPAEGYKFRNWQAVDGSTHTYTVNFTYTIKDHDVTFKANFDKVVYHTVTWSVNGVETTEEVEEGTEIKFNAPTENIPEGYVFMGWYASTYGPSDDAPEFVTSATINGDVTYYAVFAKQAEESTETTTVELTNEQIARASDEDKANRSKYKERDIAEWSGKFGLPLNSGTYSLSLNRSTDESKSQYNSHLTTPLCSAPIKTVIINTNNGTSVGREVYLCSSNEVGAATKDNAKYGSATVAEKNETLTIDVEGNPTQLHIYSSATFYIESIKLVCSGGVTYSDYRTSVSTEPSIEVNDNVTYAADITSGEIPYIINNPVEGTNLTASTTAEWIQSVSVDVVGSKVTFTMTKNEETSSRKGEIKLEYEGAKTKSVTVTQLVNYIVLVNEPTNGTLTVTYGEDNIVDGIDELPDGTELTITATPNAGYKLVKWEAIGDDNVVLYTSTEASGTYTVNSDVTFTAEFTEIPSYTITWSVNGDETKMSSTTVNEGQEIPFADPTDEMIPEDYKFMGWSVSTIDGTQEKAPEFVTSAIANGNMTYYAVFAKQAKDGTTTVELTNEQIKKAIDDAMDSGLKSNVYYDNQTVGDWSGKFVYAKANEVYTLQINYSTSTSAGAYNSHLTTPLSSSSIKSIKIKTNSGSSGPTRKDREILLCSPDFVGAASASNAIYGSGTVDEDNGYITIDKIIGEPTQLSIYSAKSAINMESLVITYAGGTAYYGYCTLVEIPTTTTITIAKACTNGEGTYYGTYSCGKAFVVPDDLIVSEISVIDKKLLVKSYSTGDVVPANTGVMISAIEPGEYKVKLSDETGTSVLGSGNMLYASGDNGITAGEMGDAHPDCIYYRLTMHKKVTLGYYWGAADGAAFALAANKAYLAVPTETAAKISGFNIGGGETTGIAGVETDGANNGARKIYNLQGQRVSEPLASGLYIIDGRKVVVK